MTLCCWALLTPLLYFFVTFHPTRAFVCKPRVPLISCSVSSSSLCASSRPVIDWAKQQTLQKLVPKEDAIKIIDELVNNKELIDSTEQTLETNRESLEKRIRDEDRSVEQILGPTTTNRVLTSVTNVQYDKDVVSTFLNSDAINSLFARVLYDAIQEFTQRMDIFGNIINTLPIIGPMRKTITQGFQQQLDRTLGPLIRSFLQAYTKVAISQAIDFILSTDNQKMFASANQNLIRSLLQRPVNTLLPPGDTLDKLQEEIFGYIRNDFNMTDVERYLDVVYDVVEDKSVSDVVNVDELLDASPTLQTTLDTIWTKMKSADTAGTVE